MKWSTVGERESKSIYRSAWRQPLPIGNGWIKDLSRSGAFIKSDRDLRLHTLVEVSIALSPPSWRTAVIEAHVSRKLDAGVVIEWCEFAPSVTKDVVRSASRSSP
jgi:hypothetical protein